ncbi:putative ubiquitin-like protein YukD [Streptomyces sp. LBL]|uniref:hypothetical protein n=1 Tax=Streptomyces sp. LBL TaxID=2940562 RepID=UPI00247649CD|nr:hypothetical protein [Streptomyces sp. LBL]MDH6624652.1 putative ubiquitin-like protein YukD [Streptomyces sp. LBL]
MSHDFTKILKERNRIMDATTWVSHRDYRLFKGNRLACIDTEAGNIITFGGTIADHGTYKHLPEDFKLGVDATTWVYGKDYRLFRGRRLVCIDTEDGNSVTFDGKIADHNTYKNLPEDFKLDIDATTWVSHRDYRLFKGDHLVCIDTTNGNAITYDGRIADHGTYENLPKEFKLGVDATTWVSGKDYRLFRGRRLVCIDTENGNSVTFDGKIADHGTYKNLSSFWTS